MANVTIYSTPSCVYCNMAKDYFKANNVAYTELNVAEDDAAREDMVKKSQQLGVPVIDVDGKIVVGFNERVLGQLLGIKK